jgi:hypothetical protein
MITAMAELDASDIVANEIIPIVKLCGNLPLCIGVVAGRK